LNTSYTNKETTQENFQNAIDLLSRIKSNNSQEIADPQSADLEYTINPWTTKLYNLKSTEPIAKIGFYKPHLFINNEKYCKLGDMISLNANYLPPQNTDYTLLIKKIGSDIKPPVNYNQIVSFGNSNIPSIYYEYDKFITGANNFTNIITNLNDSIMSLNILNNILRTNEQIIKPRIIKNISEQVKLKIGKSSDIPISILADEPISGNNNILSVNVNDLTQVIIPFGLDTNVLLKNGENVDLYFDIDNIDIFRKKTTNEILNVLKGNILFSQLKESKSPDETNIIIENGKIPIINLIMGSELINYMKNLCSSIYTILNQVNNPEFIKYLNLADSSQNVNKLLSALSTISPVSNNLNNIQVNNDINNIINSDGMEIIKAYGNSNPETLLGSIINIIMNESIEYYYPVLKFRFNELVRPITNNTTKINAKLNNVQTFMVKSANLKLISSSNIKLNNNSESYRKISNEILPRLGQLTGFQNALDNDIIDFFPLQIYEPIAPDGYKSLGHVFCNITNDLYKIKTSDNIACVPAHCVKDIRAWNSSDKVFEYNKKGTYWAVYKNPYTGTFISVNKAGEFPPGKVCKVVACVAKCNVVDELIKADDCARKYANMNKNVMDKITDTPDLVGGLEDEIYLEKIKRQSDNITRLRTKAQHLQIDIDKAAIINEQSNKRTLQNYVDTQGRNINLVAGRIEQDKNKIDLNVNIPIDAINNILNMIRNMPEISLNEKERLITKIMATATAKNQNIITQGQYDANLNTILRSCPEYDLTGLVKRSIVGDVCYGCGTP
jgi:hypothetical protein